MSRKSKSVLQAVESSQYKSVPEPLLIPVETAASMLGISVWATRSLVAAERIPIIRSGRGGRIFVPRAAVVDAIAGMRA